MEIKFVDLGRQYTAIKQEIDRAIARVLERADFILGEDVARFEEEFAAYCGAKYAVGVDNGTSALELGLRALGIGPGCEVLVPANSFIASAAAVSFAGATPVFVDVDAATYNIDVEQASRNITPRTKAILPVHLYGQPADMGAVMDLAERYGLSVVEDACQAHGARWDGRRVGTFGQVGAFSFYPGKNLGAYGDGGALVTDDPALAEQARILRNCGQQEKYRHVRLGSTSRLDTIQAAVLRVKLPYLDGWNELRRQRARLYAEALAGTALVLPWTAPAAEHVYHLFVVQVERRDQLRSYLTRCGVATGIHYPTPIHLQPAYGELGYRSGALPVSEQCSSRLLSLPIFPELGEDEVSYVAARLHSFIGQG